MKTVLASLLGLTAAWDQEWTLDEIKGMDHMGTFKSWASAFGRNYSSVEEESTKFLVWLDNLHLIATTNSEDLSYKLGLNQFSDMTSDEFRYYVHGEDGSCFKDERRNLISNSNGQDIIIEDEFSVNSNAENVDWTEKGVVTPVKNQGQCGSCWAFSTTGAIECNYAIQNGKLNSLSEQELVDCAGILRYGCNGCSGGQMTGGMKYVENEGGLCLESDYKYTAKDGTCKASTCGTKYDANSGYTEITQYSSSALEAAVNKGCVSIGIEADQTTFQHYSSGVFSGSCGTKVDHGVLVVGYGEEGGKKFWKVKNSWGDSWGEEGYIRMCRDCNKNGKDGECGILTGPVQPEF